MQVQGMTLRDAVSLLPRRFCVHRESGAGPRELAPGGPQALRSDACFWGQHSPLGEIGDQSVPYLPRAGVAPRGGPLLLSRGPPASPLWGLRRQGTPEAGLPGTPSCCRT